MNKTTTGIRSAKETTLEKIKLHVLHPEQYALTPSQQHKLKRLILTDRLIYQYKTKQNVVAWLKKYMAVDDQVESYSERTAERDYYDAQQLFADSRKFNKVYKRNFYMDWLEQRMNKMDDRNFVAAMKVLADLSGMKYEDIEPPQKNLEITTIELAYDLESLGIAKVPDLEEKKKKLRAKKRQINAIKWDAETIEAEYDKEKGSLQ